MRKSVSAEEIENKWMITYRDEDNPAMLIDQLDWLREIGFTEVDVLLKYFNFALYGGRKI
jgi:tRNA (cmo5U34)-methyltransferase